MKRITYISRLKTKLSSYELNTLGVESQLNNKEAGITGILIYFNELFFQIIEGEDEAIHTLYKKIKEDKRHEDVLCLKTEENISELYFPEWSMKVINLDRRTDELSRPIKLLLQALLDSHTIVEKYTQSSVLKIISDGLNPLNVEPRQTERVILFGDILSYTYTTNRLKLDS